MQCFSTCHLTFKTAPFSHPRRSTQTSRPHSDPQTCMHASVPAPSPPRLHAPSPPPGDPLRPQGQERAAQERWGQRARGAGQGVGLWAVSEDRAGHTRVGLPGGRGREGAGKRNGLRKGKKEQERGLGKRRAARGREQRKRAGESRAGRLALVIIVVT